MSSLDKNYEVTQVIDRPIEEVFAFFSDVKNLEKITPPWLKFRVLYQSTPAITEGTRFKYKLKIKGIPVYWKSLISSWKLNESFVDEQLKGPYAKWHHTHLFKNLGGRTQMTDRIIYRVPMGHLGQLLLGSYIHNDIKKIFLYRSKVVTELLK